MTGTGSSIGRGRAAERGVSAVVGVVVLVGLTVVLASAGGAFLGLANSSLTEPAPQAQVSASLNATDGWPGGQRLRLTHDAGDVLAVADLAFVVELPDPGASARLSGFPTRRLTAENIQGKDVFDGTHAGVDGAVDAAYTDGEWASGQRVEFRIAQRELAVESGDGVRVTVIHEPTNAPVAEATCDAE